MWALHRIVASAVGLFHPSSSSHSTDCAITAHDLPSSRGNSDASGMFTACELIADQEHMVTDDTQTTFGGHPSLDTPLATAPADIFSTLDRPKILRRSLSDSIGILRISSSPWPSRSSVLQAVRDGALSSTLISLMNPAGAPSSGAACCVDDLTWADPAALMSTGVRTLLSQQGRHDTLGVMQTAPLKRSLSSPARTGTQQLRGGTINTVFASLHAAATPAGSSCQPRGAIAEQAMTAVQSPPLDASWQQLHVEFRGALWMDRWCSVPVAQLPGQFRGALYMDRWCSVPTPAQHTALSQPAVAQHRPLSPAGATCPTATTKVLQAAHNNVVQSEAAPGDGRPATAASGGSLCGEFDI